MLYILHHRVQSKFTRYDVERAFLRIIYLAITSENQKVQNNTHCAI